MDGGGPDGAILSMHGDLARWARLDKTLCNSQSFPLRAVNLGTKVCSPFPLQDPSAILGNDVDCCRVHRITCLKLWWALLDLNQQPTDYESAALTVVLRARPAIVSIKQVLAPLFIASREKPHQMPRGMQAKWLGRLQQTEVRLVRGPAPLAVITRVTTGHKILPARRASA